MTRQPHAHRMTPLERIVAPLLDEPLTPDERREAPVAAFLLLAGFAVVLLWAVLAVPV